MATYSIEDCAGMIEDAAQYAMVSNDFDALFHWIGKLKLTAKEENKDAMFIQDLYGIVYDGDSISTESLLDDVVDMLKKHFSSK